MLIWGHSDCLHEFHRKMKKMKSSADVPKNESKLTQMIRMRKSIRHKWVKFVCIDVALTDTALDVKIVIGLLNAHSILRRAYTDSATCLQLVRD